MEEKIHKLQSSFSEDFENLTNGDLVEKIGLAIEFLKEEMQETIDAFEEIKANGKTIETLDELVDGFCDVEFLARNAIFKIYRCLGHSHIVAHQSTLKSMLIVAKANDAKRQPDGTVKWNESGKVMKPKNWKAPDHKPIILYGKNGL